MREAILPFLGYCVLQLFVAVVGLNLVREKRIGFSGLLKAWTFGQMLCFALLQIMAVPMILLRWRFNALFWSYCGAVAVLLGFGAWRLKHTRMAFDARPRSWLCAAVLAVALLLMLCQSGAYFFGVHLDEDDARWLAEANDAMTYGDMMTRSYETGDYLGSIQVPKDATSPWPMMIAIVSRILRTRPVVFAHTLYAPVELLLLYGIYWFVAEELFESKESRAAFLFFIALLNAFLGRTVFTQSTFSLVRIWQGKATVAGVMIPLLFYLFLRINRADKTVDWLKLPVVCCAACLMSGMGITLAPIMIAVYGVYNILAYRNWKRIPLAVLAVLPSAVFLMVYTGFKSLL